MNPGIRAFLLCLFLVSVSLVCACSSLPGLEPKVIVNNTGQPGIQPGRGEYLFNDSLGNVDRPITVYTYRPLSWNTSGPVLFIMPGAGRIGEPSLDTWIPYSEHYSCLLVVPEFSFQYYPDDSWYPLGNMINGSMMTWNPRVKWTYTAIEHIFDDIRRKTGATQNTYLLFGHSAGGQFVHRLVTFLPEAGFSRAVAANAGLYVMPDYSVYYPLGLKNSTMPESGLPMVFSKKLIIMSGSKDTDPNDSSLANFPAAEAQGKTRFERAKLYFTTAQEEAGHLHVSLNWEYHVVPGVGHDEAGMAGPSAEILFEEK